METGRVNSVLSDQAHPLLASGAKETRCTSLLESLPQVMPSESLAPAVSPSQLAPSALLIAVAVFATSAVLCVIGYLALTVSGPWVGGPSERHWTAQELTVRRGDARPGKDGISVLGPDETGIVVIALNASLRSRDYPVIAWDALNVPDGVEATLLWYSDFRASRTLTRALAIEGHRIAPTDLAQDRNWIGTIGGLALALRGSFGEPIFVRGVSAKPMTPTQILSDRARECSWLPIRTISAAVAPTTSIPTMCTSTRRTTAFLPHRRCARAITSLLIRADACSISRHRGA